jgi:hypothetical protein
VLQHRGEIGGAAHTAPGLYTKPAITQVPLVDRDTMLSHYDCILILLIAVSRLLV